METHIRKFGKNNKAYLERELFLINLSPLMSFSEGQEKRGKKKIYDIAKEMQYKTH